MTVSELLDNVSAIKGSNADGCACTDLQVLMNEIIRMTARISTLEDALRPFTNMYFENPPSRYFQILADDPLFKAAYNAMKGEDDETS